MRRLTPSLALLGLVMVGCASKPDTAGKPNPDSGEPTAGLHQATVVVEGMS